MTGPNHCEESRGGELSGERHMQVGINHGM